MIRRRSLPELLFLTPHTTRYLRLSYHMAQVTRTPNCKFHKGDTTVQTLKYCTSPSDVCQKNKPSTPLSRSMSRESMLRSVVRSHMHLCPWNWVAIGHAVVYYFWTDKALSVGIRCRHCSRFRNRALLQSRVNYLFSQLMLLQDLSKLSCVIAAGKNRNTFRSALYGHLNGVLSAQCELVLATFRLACSCITRA